MKHAHVARESREDPRQGDELLQDRTLYRGTRGLVLGRAEVVVPQRAGEARRRADMVKGFVHEGIGVDPSGEPGVKRGLLLERVNRCPPRLFRGAAAGGGEGDGVMGDLDGIDASKSEGDLPDGPQRIVMRIVERTEHCVALLALGVAVDGRAGRQQRDCDVGDVVEDDDAEELADMRPEGRLVGVLHHIDEAGGLLCMMPGADGDRGDRGRVLDEGGVVGVAGLLQAQGCELVDDRTLGAVDDEAVEAGGACRLARLMGSHVQVFLVDRVGEFPRGVLPRFSRFLPSFPGPVLLARRDYRALGWRRRHLGQEADPTLLAAIESEDDLGPREVGSGDVAARRHAREAEGDRP